MVAYKISNESQEEIYETFKIENTINDMLNKVMEENDSLNSFDFEDDEFEEDSFQISRFSTRHQTSNSSNIKNFNRGNKRNLTEDLYNKKISPPLNITFSTSNCSLENNPSFCFANNFNSPSPNFSQNTNNFINFNNNLNQSFQSQQPFNTKFNTNVSSSNFIRNALPYSKTVAYNNQKDVFKNTQSILNFDNNFKQNNFNENNNNNLLNLDTGFKRVENRKKTYNSLDIFHNNISNYLQNNNINNEIINNTKISNIANDSFIYELKSILEKTGKIDYHIYNLVKGKFLSVIKNHKGSKLFQKYIKSIHPEEIIHLLYLELNKNLEEFITDSYSNYFCKKFFTFLSQKDRIDFLKKIQKSIVRFSCHSIGTYPIQTIIENIGSRIEKIIIILAIENNIEKLIYDSFGCHVIEKIISFIDEVDIPFIYSYISNNFLRLAYNNNAICIIKKILTFTDKINLHNKIRKIIKENAFGLIQHPFGNFVIQVVIEYWNDYKAIINLYKNSFFDLSLEKYASNVIERFIEKDEEVLNEFIDEIINTNKIYEVMKSSYGNYVIQKALKISQKKYKQKLLFNAAKQINYLIEGKLIIKWKSLLIPHIKELNQEQIQILHMQKFFEK